MYRKIQAKPISPQDADEKSEAGCPCDCGDEKGPQKQGGAEVLYTDDNKASFYVPQGT